jgi:hypothetical protein
MEAVRLLRKTHARAYGMQRRTADSFNLWGAACLRATDIMNEHQATMCLVDA